MTNKNNNQAKHMSYGNGKNYRMRGKGRIVALALAGVLAIGGVSAACVAGLGKLPSQAPAVAQTVAAKPAAEVTAAKAVSKNADTSKTAAKATAKKAESKPEAKKAAVKRAEAPKQAAQQQQAPKQATQPTTQQQAPKQSTQQAVQPATPQAEAPKAQATADTSTNSGLEAKVSREQCIATALAHVGAGGQAKGEARNVTARQVTGGGTVYYVVELDLGDVHYTVNVDAIDGGVIGADSVHAGTRTLLDEQGVEIEGTETPAE